MISTLSRTGCVLYFVKSRLARDLDNHLQCVIFVRCYQHIVDAVVVVHDLRDSAKFALELTSLTRVYGRGKSKYSIFPKTVTTI